MGHRLNLASLAPALKVKLVALGVHHADEIERSLTAFAAEGNSGVVFGPHAVTLTNRDLIVALAARLRLPDMWTAYCAAPSRRLAGAVPDEPSDRRQSQDRQGSRPRRSGHATRPRRRND